MILKKSESLLRGLDSTARNRLLRAGKKRHVSQQRCSGNTRNCLGLGGSDRHIAAIPDVVQYSSDNWLRFWFNGLDAGSIAKRLTMAKSVTEWTGVMESVLRELFRVTKEKGSVAFEVGEVRKGTIALDEIVIPAGMMQVFPAGASS